MKHRICAAMALAGALFAAQAAAQDFPRQPVKLVVPFAAGGPADIQARWLGVKLGAALGQPVVIDNRAGAGGVLGAQAVINAPADGHTLLFASVGAVAIAPYLMDKQPYDVARDLAPVIRVATAPMVLVSSATGRHRDLAALVADAKAHPGKVSFASAGPGTTTQLGSELLKREVGAEMIHIPYKGAAPALTDVMAGTVDVMFADAPVVLPYIKGGKLRALAVGTPTRVEGLPDVPTTAEGGYKNVLATTWYGVLAPAKTPPAVVKRLNSAIATVLGSPDAVSFFGSQALIVNGGTPEEFGSFVASESKRWTALAKAAGVRMD